MKRKLSNQFWANYILMVILSILIVLLAFWLMGFSGNLISQKLVRNQYTAEKLMQDDIFKIDTDVVTRNGGGVQVVDDSYQVVLSEGINKLGEGALLPAEFTRFLVQSQSKDRQYSFDIAYHAQNGFWLIVTFPTSLRIDFNITHNAEAAPADMASVTGVLSVVALFYLLLLFAATYLYSRFTSRAIIKPLRKLCEGVNYVRKGDYSTRVELKLKNEFGELQDAFNSMAEEIEKETALRKTAEESRKKLMLDISHDLKNPLASVIGYAETCLDKPGLTEKERQTYLKIIYENGLRADQLIQDLFELSKMDSPGYRLRLCRHDVCEYLRIVAARFIPQVEGCGFNYDIAIPEEEISVLIDAAQMDRVFQNLFGNAMRYNPPGTHITLQLREEKNQVVVTFADNGNGMPAELAKDVFRPFVTANSADKGTGLGLAIADKIIKAHKGQLRLVTNTGEGCAFLIYLPKV